MRSLLPLALLVAAPPLPAQSPLPQPRTISVNGHAEISAAPDRVTLSVAVETEGDQAAAAVQENAQRSAKVIAALKQLIGSDDRVTTTGYSVHPRYTTARPGEPVEPKIIGYTASNTVAVESRRIEAAGKLIDAAVSAGANRISQLRFTLADRAPYLRTALEQAGREAQAQAESIAAALGVELRGVLSAATSGPPIVQSKHFESYQMAAMRTADAASPIESGDVTVAADVQVVYEIGPR
ncbi:MAG TPA: SIMPL domain-containing protein [Terriglobales bacterium]|nr:SIMPL domain-containing protein [Terriglobales bacterium]